VPLATATACPACPGTLREREVGPRRLTECGRCGGFWLPAALLDALCAEAERAGIADLAPEIPKPEREEEIRYRPCGACGVLMMRGNFGGSSGVVVDLCRSHGVWLDAHELERVLAWARGGGLERERTRRVERARREIPSRPSMPFAPIPGGRLGDAWGEAGLGLLEFLAALLKRLG
jgi:Zn-finger nucleic acid-binding protein